MIVGLVVLKWNSVFLIVTSLTGVRGADIHFQPLKKPSLPAQRKDIEQFGIIQNNDLIIARFHPIVHRADFIDKFQGIIRFYRGIIQIKDSAPDFTYPMTTGRGFLGTSNGDIIRTSVIFSGNYQSQARKHKITVAELQSQPAALTFIIFSINGFRSFILINMITKQSAYEGILIVLHSFIFALSVIIGPQKPPDYFLILRNITQAAAQFSIPGDNLALGIDILQTLFNSVINLKPEMQAFG